MQLSLSHCVSMKLIQVNIHSTVWKDWRVFFGYLTFSTSMATRLRELTRCQWHFYSVLS